MAVAGISRVAPIGKRFGRLTVISGSFPVANSNSSQVRCRCKCGDERGYYIGNLTRQREPMCPPCRASSRPARGHSRHPLFNIWKAMIQRCENPKHDHYADYGGRGIRVCDRWRSNFGAFVADVGERPSLDHTIDRVERDGHYAPGNVRWATWDQQASNRRNTVTVIWGGEVLTIAEAAKLAGIEHATFAWRLKRGWPMMKIMTAPSRARNDDVSARARRRRA